MKKIRVKMEDIYIFSTGKKIFGMTVYFSHF